MSAAILSAAALMMAVTGYSFLGGNHEVYLLEPLRRAGLASFEGDFFVTQTLQYHGLFTQIAAWLFRLDVARPAFLVVFFGLLLTTAWAWWRIVRSLGGDVVAFLVAVVVYHVLLGDRALGFYSLLQDGQFNAANVAAVALLVGIAMWIEGRVVWAGLAFGVAGAFHLNYAVVAAGIWVVLAMWEWGGVPRASLRATLARSLKSDDAFDAPLERIEEAGPTGVTSLRASVARRLARSGGRVGAVWAWGIGTALALVPSVVNVGLALPATLREREAMAFGRFVDLYVHLRHPHHYDPLAWPWWVWAAFLAPIAPAVLGWRRLNASPPERGAEWSPRSEAESASAQGGRTRGATGRTHSDAGDPCSAQVGRTRTRVSRRGRRATRGTALFSSLRGPLRLAESAPLPGGEALRSRWNVAAQVWLVLMGLQLFALLTAGVFWAGETFIQLSLWRFSPHAKLLAVSAAAVWVVRIGAESASGTEAAQRVLRTSAIVALMLLPIGVSVGLLIMGGDTDERAWAGNALLLILGSCAISMLAALGTDRIRWRGSSAIESLPVPLVLALALAIGFGMTIPKAFRDGLWLPGQSAALGELAAPATWAKAKSQPDALFLLPPDASGFSVRARRGQVVSFKLVPQLSGELAEWDRRLREVLDVDDLSVFAGGVTGYRRSQAAMRRRYDELSSAHLFAVARRYGARYVFRSREDAGAHEAGASVAWRGAEGAVLYDLDSWPAAVSDGGSGEGDFHDAEQFRDGADDGGGGGDVGATRPAAAPDE